MERFEIERERERLRLQVAELVAFAGNPYHDARGRFAQGPGAESDLSPALAKERAAITSELAAKRAATGKPPYAANSLRGMAIKEHQARMEARGEGALIPKRGAAKTPAARKPATAQTHYVPGQSPLSGGKTEPGKTTGAAEARIAAMKAKTEKAAAAEAARLKEVVAARVAKAAAAEAARAKGEEPAWLQKAKEETAKEVERMKAEQALAANKPSEVRKSLEIATGVGGLKKEIVAAIGDGADAIKKAGVLGSFGSLSVKKDGPRKTRNGAYSPGFNQVVIKNTLTSAAASATFIHEFFHHVSWWKGDRKMGGVGYRASMDPEFLAIVKRTKAYADIKSNRNYFGSGFNSYLARPEELFARAGMQFTIERSGSATLMHELNNRISRHWQHDDFSELRSYFERTLTAGKG